MNILIVDDEPLACERLAAMIKKIPGCHVVGYAGDGVEAVYKTHNPNIDVVLMDIRMPKMSGLEAARHINEADHPPIIIFVTCFVEYTLEAFSAHPAGYLLKPVRFASLEDTLSHVQRTRIRKVAEPTVCETFEREYISCNNRGNVSLIALNKVCYIESFHKHTRILHDHGYTYSTQTLKEFETTYGTRLLRIHRSILVNKTYLRAMERNTAKVTSYQVRLHGVPKALPVSRRYLPTVRDCVKTFMYPTKIILKREQRLQNKKGLPK